MLDKRALRAELLAQRTAFDGAAASETIVRTVMDCAQFRRAKRVMLYLPTKGEVDLRTLLAADKEFCLPVMQGETLIAAQYAAGDATVRRAFSVEEPRDICPIDPETIDLCLVPGVGFDRSGTRLGFGKGYYDRFLPCTAAAKVGVCFAFQLCEMIPRAAHDVPMDAVVTEREILLGKENK